MYTYIFIKVLDTDWVWIEREGGPSLRRNAQSAKSTGLAKQLEVDSDTDSGPVFEPRADSVGENRLGQ